MDLPFLSLTVGCEDVLSLSRSPHVERHDTIIKMEISIVNMGMYVGEITVKIDVLKPHGVCILLSQHKFFI